MRLLHGVLEYRPYLQAKLHEQKGRLLQLIYDNMGITPKTLKLPEPAATNPVVKAAGGGKKQQPQQQQQQQQSSSSQKREPFGSGDRSASSTMRITAMQRTPVSASAETNLSCTAAISNCQPATFAVSITEQAPTTTLSRQHLARLRPQQTPSPTRRPLRTQPNQDSVDISVNT